MFPTKVTKPIIDIYPPTYQIGDMVYEPSIKEITAANHAAKQIIDWLDDNVMDAKNSHYPGRVVWAITGEQLEALKNLVKEK
jgi:hypothetical protein